MTSKDTEFNIVIDPAQLKPVPANPNCKKAPIFVQFGEEAKMPIKVQTPLSGLPFVLKDDDSSLTVSLRRPTESAAAVEQYEWFVRLIGKIDKAVQQCAMTKPKEVLNKDQLTQDACEALFKSPMKPASGSYPPNLKLKFTGRGGAADPTPTPDRFPTFPVFDAKKQLIPDCPFKECFARGNDMIAIIECNGMWAAGGSFGCSWKIVQMIMYKVDRTLPWDTSAMPDEHQAGSENALMIE